MAKLKIGFVLDDTLDTPDGVQQYVLTLGGWLQAQGHTVHYLVGQTTRTDIANVHSLGRNVKVRFNGNGMSTPLPAGKRAIRKLLQRENFDVLHVQLPYSPFMAGRVIAAASPETVVFGTFHIAPHSRAVESANRLLGRVLKRSLRRFDTIVSVSSAAAAFAQDAYGIQSDILPNVVDSARFRATSTTLPAAKSERLQLIYVGRLVPRKGCQVLLRAAALLSADSAAPPFHLTVCGRGPLQSELEAFIRSNKLDSDVTLTGFVTEEEKARYLRSADIAVYPSTGGESFGIVLLEAMAAERPVVLAADNPGYHSVMEPQPDSLFPVANPQALADTLLRYMTDDIRRGASLQWQRRYVQQFDVAAVGRRLVGRYQQALRERRNVR